LDAKKCQWGRFEMSMAGHDVSVGAGSKGQEDGLSDYVSAVLVTPPRPMSEAHPTEFLHGFPPFPAPPEGVTIVPFSAFVPAGYRHAAGPSGDPIEVDAWVGIPTVKLLNDEEASQKRKAKKKRRNAGNAVDAEGRPIPWWEEWEVGEALRAMSEPSFDGYVFVVHIDHQVDAGGG